MQYLHRGVKTALTPAPQPRPGVKQAVDMVARDVSPGLLACQAGTAAPLGTRLEWEGPQGSPSTSLADLHLLPFHSGVQTMLAFLSRLLLLGTQGLHMASLCSQCSPLCLANPYSSFHTCLWYPSSDPLRKTAPSLLPSLKVLMTQYKNYQLTCPCLHTGL